MGNTPGILNPDSQLQTQSQSRDIKNLTQQADKLSNILHLDTYSTSVIRRIFVQKRQTHLIQIIRKIGNKEKVQLFLDQVHCANLQILDSFYEHIVRSSCDIRSQKDQIQIKQKVVPPFDREIGICGSMNLMTEKSWNPISQKYCDIVDLTKGTQNISGYQYYKEKGLQAIKNEEVCFIIMAGGKNMRYDLNEYKQCDPLTQLPSKSSLIQIFLKKFEALGKLINVPIHIYIMVNDEQHKRKIRKIKSLKIPNPEYIEIDFLTQINYGCLDLAGKLVLTDKTDVFMHPNGNGDLWGNFQPKNIEKLKLNQFKYFQIFGVSNMLEHCFDCYMIGKLIHQRLPWVTMCKQDPNPKNTDPVMFINSDKTIHVRDPQQIGYGMDSNNLGYMPTNCPHTFLQNSVFSLQFIKLAVQSPGWLQHRKYHCKLKRIDHRAPLSNYTSILVFERQITDIFAITSSILPHQQSPQNRLSNINLNLNKMKSRGAVILMNQNMYHSPYYNKYDRLVGVVNRSQMHKTWLNIGQKYDQNQDKNRDYIQEKLKEICQIDPAISLQGQNLEQIIKQLANLNAKIQYPLYICDQSYQQASTNENMGSTLKESKFANLNYFTDGI